MTFTLCLSSSSLQYIRVAPENHFHRNSYKMNVIPINQGGSMISTVVYAGCYNHPHDQTHLGTHRNQECKSRHVEKLINETKQFLFKMGENRKESVIMIDTLQRLGIDYHFHDEIKDILRRHYADFNLHGGYTEYGLYHASTRFLLLRKQGYNVSADDGFETFKDSKDGSFMKELTVDIKGLMGLYEASQLNTGLEDSVLDKAEEFSTRFLNASMRSLCDREARLVGNTLNHPYHKSLARFMANDFLKDFSTSKGWANMFRELARMDLDLTQTLHQKEVSQVSKWWNEKGLARELKFARDEPAKWYLWSMAAISDPKFSEQRVELTKPISFIYLLDDIFDVYGSLDQLTLFTKVIERWDFRMAEKLPECMKICFSALDEVTNEFCRKIINQRGFNPVNIIRKSWSSLCNAFLVEARWFASGNLPNSEDYLKNGIISSGMPLALLHLFFLLETDINSSMAANDIFNNSSSIVSSISTILRLSDDLGGNTDENQDGEDGSYVDCYMKDRKGCSAEMARNHVRRMISDEWKRINRECLISSPRFSPIFSDSCVNFARIVPLMYSYDQNHNLPLLENSRSRQQYSIKHV